MSPDYSFGLFLYKLTLSPPRNLLCWLNGKARSKTTSWMNMQFFFTSSTVLSGRSVIGRERKSQEHLSARLVLYAPLSLILCLKFFQSQLKKLFFGALRVRKEQDAKDPKLRGTRPATSVITWDAIKNRMDESLERVRR